MIANWSDSSNIRPNGKSTKSGSGSVWFFRQSGSECVVCVSLSLQTWQKRKCIKAWEIINIETGTLPPCGQFTK